MREELSLAGARGAEPENIVNNRIRVIKEDDSDSLVTLADSFLPGEQHGPKKNPSGRCAGLESEKKQARVEHK